MNREFRQRVRIGPNKQNREGRCTVVDSSGGCPLGVRKAGRKG